MEYEVVVHPKQLKMMLRAKPNLLSLQKKWSGLRAMNDYRDIVFIDKVGVCSCGAGRRRAMRTAATLIKPDSC